MYGHFLTCFSNDTQFTLGCGWIAEVTIGFAWGDFDSTCLLTRRSLKSWLRGAWKALRGERERCERSLRFARQMRHLLERHTDGWTIKGRCWSVGDGRQIIGSIPEFCSGSVLHKYEPSAKLLRPLNPTYRVCPLRNEAHCPVCFATGKEAEAFAVLPDCSNPKHPKIPITRMTRSLLVCWILWGPPMRRNAISQLFPLRRFLIAFA